ncbi:unnamed protein product [Rhodiola kirilowii]
MKQRRQHDLQTQKKAFKPYKHQQPKKPKRINHLAGSHTLHHHFQAQNTLNSDTEPPPLQSNHHPAHLPTTRSIPPYGKSDHGGTEHKPDKATPLLERSPTEATEMERKDEKRRTYRRELICRR